MASTEPIQPERSRIKARSSDRSSPNSRFLHSERRGDLQLLRRREGKEEEREEALSRLSFPSTSTEPVDAGGQGSRNYCRAPTGSPPHPRAKRCAPWRRLAGAGCRSRRATEERREEASRRGGGNGGALPTRLATFPAGATREARSTTTAGRTKAEVGAASTRCPARAPWVLSTATRVSVRLRSRSPRRHMFRALFLTRHRLALSLLPPARPLSSLSSRLSLLGRRATRRGAAQRAPGGQGRGAHEAQRDRPGRGPRGESLSLSPPLSLFLSTS